MFSQANAIYKAHETIDVAIRMYDCEPVKDSVVELVSNNSFDEFYQVGSLFLRSQGPAHDFLWDQASSLRQVTNISELAHLIRLDLSLYESLERGDVGFGIASVTDALRNHHEDEDVVSMCVRVINTFPYEVKRSFHKLEDLLYK